MKQEILSGPAVLPAHARTFTFGRFNRVFFDKENEFTTERLKSMSEEEFRGIVLKGVKETQDKADKASNLVNDHSELKTLCETTFKEFKTSQEDVKKSAEKIVKLERALMAAQRNIDPNESPDAYMKRAFPDDCKRIGEAIRKGERNISLVQRAESTATQPAIVPVEFDTAIYSRVVSYGAFKYLDVHPMSAQTENLIVESAEPVAVFVPENGVIPETGLALAPVGLTAKKIGVILGISGELLQDADIDVGAYVSLKFARAVAARSDYAAYMSNGTSDTGGLNGGFTGVFNAGTIVPAAAGHTTIAKMTLADIINMVTSLPEAVLEAGNLSWFMNPLLLPQFLGILDANGRPIFLNALEAPAYGAIGTILGIPVRPVSVAPSNNAAGMPIAALGDPLAYAVGIRMDYQFDYSDHARYTAFQRVYRGLMRGAYKIKNPANMLVMETAAQ